MKAKESQFSRLKKEKSQREKCMVCRKEKAVWGFFGFPLRIHYVCDACKEEILKKGYEE